MHGLSPIASCAYGAIAEHARANYNQKGDGELVYDMKGHTSPGTKEAETLRTIDHVLKPLWEPEISLKASHWHRVRPTREVCNEAVDGSSIVEKQDGGPDVDHTSFLHTHCSITEAYCLIYDLQFSRCSTD